MGVTSVQSSTQSVLPGLALAIGGAAAATGLSLLVPGLSVAMVAVVLGAVLVNLGMVPVASEPGVSFAARSVLRAAVVLLGLRLSFGDLTEIGVRGLMVVVATLTVTLVGTQVIGRRLGVSRDLGLLVAVGYAICGVSAIAAVRDSTKAEDREVAAAMGLVTLFGSAAMVTLPVIALAMGLADGQIGLWVGASVHDVAQVVATASAIGPEVVTTAVAVKLARVALLAPVVVIINVMLSAGSGQTAGRRPRQVLPLFVVGFLAMAAVRTTGLVPDLALTAAGQVEKALLAVALVGLGAGIRISDFRRLGPRPLVLGLVAWVLVAGVALAGSLWAA
ncbi:MAG: putative sulfate exporter family transporter [Actinomycetota bacterium]